MPVGSLTARTWARRVIVRRVIGLASSLILVATFGSLQHSARGDAASAGTLLAYNPTPDSTLQSDSSVMTGCAECHRMAEGRSHPVGVTPSMAVPGDLPLVEGRMACTTCHTDDYTAHQSAQVTHDPLLRARVAEGGGCTQCHTAGGSGAAGAHATGLAMAHVDSPAPATATLSQAGGWGTNQCLSCHDGLISSDVSLGAYSFSAMGMSNLEHPVNVAYPSSGTVYRETGDPLSLNSPSTLDSRLHLVNGQIACTTCHSPYSSEKKLLVMSNYGSRMCLSCHRM